MQPPKPIVFGQRAEPFLLAWLEPPLAFELAKLPNPLGRIGCEVFAFERPAQERLQSTQTSISRHGAAAECAVRMTSPVGHRFDAPTRFASTNASTWCFLCDKASGGGCSRRTGDTSSTRPNETFANLDQTATPSFSSSFGVEGVLATASDASERQSPIGVAR